MCKPAARKGRFCCRVSHSQSCLACLFHFQICSDLSSLDCSFVMLTLCIRLISLSPRLLEMTLKGEIAYSASDTPLLLAAIWKSCVATMRRRKRVSLLDDTAPILTHSLYSQWSYHRSLLFLSPTQDIEDGDSRAEPYLCLVQTVVDSIPSLVSTVASLQLPSLSPRVGFCLLSTSSTLFVSLYLSHYRSLHLPIYSSILYIYYMFTWHLFP